MSAGSIIVDLLMRTGSFETDTARAAKTAEKRAKQIQKSFEDAGMKVGIAFTAAFAAIGAGYIVFDRLIKQVGDFQDIAEKTGGSAEGFAGFAVALGTTNTQIESLVDASIKLTKGLTGVDDESKAAGAALAALGLNIEDFKKLAPEDQISAAAKALAGFQDGAQKTAVAIALFGKSGAQLLPFLKELESQGGRQNVLTAEQIRLADEYADKQGKARAQLNLYAQTLAIAALPAVTSFTQALSDSVKQLLNVDKGSSDLAGNSGVKDFADSSAIALAELTDALYNAGIALFAVGKSIQVVLADSKVALNFAQKSFAAFLPGDAYREQTEDLKKAIADRDRILKEANAAYERLSNGLGLADRVRDRINSAESLRLGQNPTDLARRGRGSNVLPQIDFEGITKKTPKGKDADSDFKTYLSNLEKQIQKTTELSTVEKLLDDIRRKSLTVTPAQQDRLMILAKEIDATKEAIRVSDERATRRRKDDEDSLNAIREIEEADRARLKALTDSGPAAQLEKQRKEMLYLADAYEKGRISAEEFNDAATGFLNLGAAKEQLSEMEQFTKKAAENIQDALGDGLYDILNGNFKNIGASFTNMINRMVAEALAADLSRKLFGSAVSGGSGGGLIGSAISAIAGYFSPVQSFDTTALPTGDFSRLDRFADGGMPPIGRPSIVGERGPELFVPRTAGTIVPNEMLGGQKSGGDVYQTIEYYNNGPIDRRSQSQLAAAALQGARQGRRIL